MTDMDETAVEAVAWMYERPWPDAMPAREVRDQQWSTLAGRYAGWTETPLYAENPATARVAKLEEALRWALPLAERAVDDHRMERMRCGHNDITGTYKNGVTWVGIHQSEVDQIEFAREVLAS